MGELVVVAILQEATRGAPHAHDIRACLTGSLRIYTADQAVGAVLADAARQARLPEAGATSHWWNCAISCLFQILNC